MAVSKAQKAEILAELIQKVSEAKSIGFSATSTLTVEEFANLRQGLREVGATYTIAKKTLIKIALKEALGIEVDLANLPGQIGMVCSNEDAVAGLGKVNALVKETKGEKITWAACIFEGEYKDLEETKVLAGLPSKETLLGRLVGSMKSPISGLARFFDAASKDLESQGKETVGQLEGENKEEVAEAPAAKEEAPKEEVKTDSSSDKPTKDESADVSSEVSTKDEEK
ncbi:50S ribosomal protein L10 [Candidatus Gracilibacteria bacterium]|nr:50S ribosomal protein L10 [Candidatus Gracilibacteria bacterium]